MGHRIHDGHGVVRRGYGGANAGAEDLVVSGEVISMDDFRKSAAMVGSENDLDEEMRETQALIHKHLVVLLREVRHRDVPMGLVAMNLFTEACSALHACEWEPDEISKWLNELTNDGFFNRDEDDEDDE